MGRACALGAGRPIHAVAGASGRLGEETSHFAPCIFEVDRKLAAFEPVHLLWCVAVEYRWPAAGRQLHLGGEQGTAALLACHPGAQCRRR